MDNFIKKFGFVNIIGATNLKQLEENISSIEVNLSEEVLSKINEVHSKIPNPSP